MTKVNQYVLSFKQSSLEIDKYMPFLRYLIYYHESYWAPYSVNYTKEILELINGEIFAQRLGLIMFKIKEKEENSQEEEIVEEFELLNESDQVKDLYSESLKGKKLEPLNSQELLLKVPPRFHAKIIIVFKKGKGSSHARFSLLEGYRFDKKESKVNFEMTEAEFGPIWNELKTFLNVH